MPRTTSSTKRPIVIRASALRTPTRPSFFEGRLLSADDLRREQEYLDHKRHLQNLATLGAGVVTGLTVSADAAGQGVTVTAGYAVDGYGREIIVPTDVTVPWPGPDARPPRRWGVLIEYAEVGTDPVPTTDGERATGVAEGSAITVITEAPAPDDPRVVLRPFARRADGKAIRRA